jgi:ATP-binding cassette, subfamily B, bacterial PglK
VLRRIWRLLDVHERRRLGKLAPLVLLASAAELIGLSAVIPFLTLLADPDAFASLPVVGQVVDLEGLDSTALLRAAGIALAAAVLLTNGVLMMSRYQQSRVTRLIEHTLSTRLLRHYLAQGWGFMLTQNGANLTNAVTHAISRVTSGVASGLSLLAATVSIAAVTGFLIALEPLLAAASFGVLGGAYGLLYLRVRRYLTVTGREGVDLQRQRLRAVGEAIGAFRELKLTGREKHALRKFSIPGQRYAALQARVTAVIMLPRLALEGLAVAGAVVATTVIAGREGALTATLPLLGAYAFGALRLMPAMQQVFGAFASLRNTLGAVERVEADLLAAASDARESDVAPAPFTREIALHDVRYRYPSGDDEALRGVDLTLRKGGSVALVGATGSGKSTLIAVLLGLLEPTGGRVSIDGAAIDDARAYRKLFGYVPQEIFLIDDSVRRNVAIGLPDDAIDEAAVRRACRLAQIDAFVESELAQGYDTLLGERGVRLSGGQRQRIGIARALYHRPAVLVFDEATSALDVHTERRVMASLQGLAGEFTLVMIAHRLESVAALERVVVLEGGRVVDAGAPGAVIARYRAAGGATGDASGGAAASASGVSTARAAASASSDIEAAEDRTVG